MFFVNDSENFYYHTKKESILKWKVLAKKSNFVSLVFILKAILIYIKFYKVY